MAKAASPVYHADAMVQRLDQLRLLHGADHSPARTRIAFLAVTQAHQFLHWLPAALRLSHEPGVEVTVLSGSRAGLEFIGGYDPDGRLKLKRLVAPAFRPDGLFTPPGRRLTLLLNHQVIGSFPTIVTTETTSSILYQLPWFRSKIVHLKHGAGDREGGYNPKHGRFDLTLVNGPKDKERLIARGLATEANCEVVGYSKFELVRPPKPVFPNGKPLALYNPHFDEKVSSWFAHGAEVVRAMERAANWNFVVAPHVKLQGGPNVRSTAPNILIDRGSIRSIDMSYTELADVYIGDVSSQVYEFLRRPRPCIFLNFEGIEWEGDQNYAHWRLGQVIQSPDQLGPALERARQLQPEFETDQRTMAARSLDPSPEPASERQARAILKFARQNEPIG